MLQNRHSESKARDIGNSEWQCSQMKNSTGCSQTLVPASDEGVRVTVPVPVDGGGIESVTGVVVLEAVSGTELAPELRLRPPRLFVCSATGDNCVDISCACSRALLRRGEGEPGGGCDGTEGA